MEKFLTQIEAQAAPAFRAIMDEGKRRTDNALPLLWPPQRAKRAALSWWIAAQILRTDRQRQRLSLVQAEGAGDALAEPAVNGHLRYIVEMIAPLATLIFTRPWGIGFSDGCLMTSDTPVLILNGQDDHNQLLAASFWDIYLPLDPHRALFLPGFIHRERARLQQDHQFKLHGGHSIGLNGAMLRTSMRHVFFHPDHDPRGQLRDEPAREAAPGVNFLLNYTVMRPGYGVERKWLEEHPEVTESRSHTPLREEEVLQAAKHMMAQLDHAKQAYDAIVDDTGTASGGT